MQSYKLLSAFVHAENHFLSNNRIVEVCGWSLENININQNRRVTVSLLRKLLDTEKSHVIIESGQNEQKEQGFYMLVENDKCFIISIERGSNENFTPLFHTRKCNLNLFVIYICRHNNH